MDSINETSPTGHRDLRGRVRHWLDTTPGILEYLLVVVLALTVVGFGLWIATSFQPTHAVFSNISGVGGM